jgi:hypothetical protein
MSEVKAKRPLGFEELKEVLKMIDEKEQVEILRNTISRKEQGSGNW